MTAQTASIDAALTQAVETLLDAIELHDGGIRRFELQGLMSGADRCTIWGQACIESPAPYRPLALKTLVMEDRPGVVEITATLQVTDRAR